MQRITTKEPTDDIIEVGIASLKAALGEGKAVKTETPKPDSDPPALGEENVQ